MIYSLNGLAKVYKDTRKYDESIKNCKDLTKPFYCRGLDGVLQCQKSTTDCACSTGFSSCSTKLPHRYCIKQSIASVSCPFFLPVRCTNYGLDFKQCSDGICRKNLADTPSRRVCPLGSVLCPNLTCRNSLSECDEVVPCPLNSITCADMSCVDDISKCNSSVTCKGSNKVVCPDGECVDNEMYCKKLPTCNDSAFPYLCSNNLCVKDKIQCTEKLKFTCGQEKALCSDRKCYSTCQ